MQKVAITPSKMLKIDNANINFSILIFKKAFVLTEHASMFRNSIKITEITWIYSMQSQKLKCKKYFSGNVGVPLLGTP